jgi:polyferredoxin
MFYCRKYLYLKAHGFSMANKNLLRASLWLIIISIALTALYHLIYFAGMFLPFIPMLASSAMAIFSTLLFNVAILLLVIYFIQKEEGR